MPLYHQFIKQNLPRFDVDVGIPMPPLPKDVTLLGKFPTVQSMAEHAIGCLLVAEHSYFLMQHGHHVWKEALSLALEEYRSSNTHLAVSSAVKAVFHDYNGDMDSLCASIIKVVVGNRMCKASPKGKSIGNTLFANMLLKLNQNWCCYPPFLALKGFMDIVVQVCLDPAVTALAHEGPRRVYEDGILRWCWLCRFAMSLLTALSPLPIFPLSGSLGHLSKCGGVSQDTTCISHRGNSISNTEQSGEGLMNSAEAKNEMKWMKIQAQIVGKELKAHDKNAQCEHDLKLKMVKNKHELSMATEKTKQASERTRQPELELKIEQIQM
ncbi:hypothetical protein F5141DRAFT_1066148 [Pisolithus sp. B1]|nr:hypothetical protein F5141DRAFT_1066148 [Pisolithus sp. B1]